jgi:exonuclease III
MAPIRHQFKMLTCNVRGLNSNARQEDVKQVIQLYKTDLVCIRDKKWN